MKLAHVIVTKFCVRMQDMFAHVHGPAGSDADPLRRRYVDYRLKLLETICLPSIVGQSGRDFTWVILVDGGLDAVSREKIERAVRPGRGADTRIRLHEYRPGGGRGLEKLGWLEPYFTERPDWVVTTLCDSDDALPRRFVETVRARVDGRAAQDALPPFQIMGMKKEFFWDMLFTREAPFGWIREVRRPDVPSCGFSLLSRRSCDIGVMGMKHVLAHAYFGDSSGNRSRNLERHLDIYGRMFREALGRRDPPRPEEAFVDVGSAGGALTSNHGTNLKFLRLHHLSTAGPAVDRRSLWSMLKGAAPGRSRVAGVETLPDFAIDWEKLRLYARYFRRWRVALRIVERQLRRRSYWLNENEGR